jgi:hypothetical protein
VPTGETIQFSLPLAVRSSAPPNSTSTCMSCPSGAFNSVTRFACLPPHTRVDG